MEFDELSNRAIGCALEVHRNLGLGLLDAAYEQCLAHELTLRNVPFVVQYPVPMEYKRIRLGCGYRMDLLVDDMLVVELKSVERLLTIHQAQLLTWMSLAGKSVGLPMNFNVRYMRQGIKRMVL